MVVGPGGHAVAHHYGMAVALGRPAELDRVAHGPKPRRHRVGNRVPLERHRVRQPLMVKPRRVHSLTRVQSEVDDAKHDLHHRIDDRAPAW